MGDVLNFINGEHQPLGDVHTLANSNPATAATIGQVPVSSASTVAAAVAAASAAFPKWAALGQKDRSACLYRLADLIESRLGDFAQAETNDTGKPLWLAKSLDIPRACQNLRFFAEAGNQWQSESFHNQAGLNYTLQQPRGVAACISPWNLPLYLFTWKVAPALVTGNTVVAKPSEVTPTTAYLLSKLINDAGFPPGVFNIIHGGGDPTGAALVSHPDVATVSFTGGTVTGQRIAADCASTMKKVSLELGGKNPGLIFADCNFDLMIDETIRSAFANQGAVCLCTSRLLIADQLYDSFKEAFIARARSLTVGDPLDPDTRQGAIVSEAHFNKIKAAVALAKAEGGRILCGGEPQVVPGRCSRGFFYPPTVIEGLGPRCQTNQQEIFGPVVTLSRFSSEAEALALANDSSYGLAATIWTESLSRTHRLAAQLDAGIIWVNTWLTRDLRTPFGGMKASGLGREGGTEALRVFTEPKNVCISYQP